MDQALHTAVCIVGGGPAGIVLALLLARQGVDVIVLEKHKDFNRDFRGDTIHGATLRVMRELGLLDALLQVQHEAFDHAFAALGDRSYLIADFTMLPPYWRHQDGAPSLLGLRAGRIGWSRLLVLLVLTMPSPQ